MLKLLRSKVKVKITETSSLLGFHSNARPTHFIEVTYGIVLSCQ